MSQPRIEIVSGAQPMALWRAATILREGGVIAVPTDTVYGVAASLAHPAALDRIYDIKGRGDDKPLPVLLESAATLDAVTDFETPRLSALTRAFWPGAVTIVVPARAGLPERVLGRNATGVDTVGVRVPASPIMSALAAANGGALAVTSANRSGEPPATSASEAAAALGVALALVVDGGKTPGNVPSTVVDVSTGELVVLRAGAVDFESIRAVWEVAANG